MASDLNCTMFIGRLGADPEQRFLPAGDAVTNFRIACGWKSKEQEGVEWISIVTFGKLAEICAEYLKKGSQVFIQGRMRTRKWQDKEGRDRYTTEIVADRMQMLGSKRDREDSGQSEPSTESTTSRNAYKDAKEGRAPESSRGQSGFDDLEEIPFAPIGRGISGHAI